MVRLNIIFALGGRCTSSRERSIARRVRPALCHVWEPVEENGSRLVTGVGLKDKLQPISRVWPPLEMLLQHFRASTCGLLGCHAVEIGRPGGHIGSGEHVR